MQNLWALLFITINFSLAGYAGCIHEKLLTGKQIREMRTSRGWDASILYRGRFYSLAQVDVSKLQTTKKYLLQFNHATHLFLQEGLRNPWSEYNKRYLKYYHSLTMAQYLKKIDQNIKTHGYTTKIIGQSVEKKPIYGVFPKTLDPNKKTILMFGRQHGDEGTQNYIIEGFLNKVFQASTSSWHKKFQLIVYPMVNPDGADRMTRYNKNGLDLNRQWRHKLTSNPDEIGVVQRHIRTWIEKLDKPVIALDMHGSFTEDFIYRVPQDYFGSEYYQIQSTFINGLAKHDVFQKGNFQLSRGNPQMARLYFGKFYQMNAVTHETPRNISLNGARQIDDLKRQGHGLYQSIIDIY
jgi:hypothetical protein